MLSFKQGENRFLSPTLNRDTPGQPWLQSALRLTLLKAPADSRIWGADCLMAPDVWISNSWGGVLLGKSDKAWALSCFCS